MLLNIYLNDHLAGATLGRELSRRTAAANADSSYGPFLETLAREIDDDRRSLLQIMAALEVRVDPLKVRAGWLAEKVSRLKLNGRMRGYSPLSRVLEFEGLILGITGKRSGWRTLEHLRPWPAALEAFDLGALQLRATTQLEQLEAHRLDAIAQALPDA